MKSLFHSKCQVSIEFLFLFGLLFFAITIFMAVLSEDFHSFAVDKEENTMKDFGVYLQNEILTASDVNNGYHRKIYLPHEIGGIDYTISNTENSFKLVSTPSELEFTYYIPKVQGNFKKGENLIHKKKGVIYIN